VTPSGTTGKVAPVAEGKMLVGRDREKLHKIGAHFTMAKRWQPSRNGQKV